MNREEFVASLINKRNSGDEMMSYELAALIELNELKWSELDESEKKILKKDSDLSDYVKNWQLQTISSESRNTATLVKILRGFIKKKLMQKDPQLKDFTFAEQETIVDEVFKMYFGYYPNFFAVRLYKLGKV